MTWKESEMAAERILAGNGETVHHVRPSKQKRGGRWFTASNDIWGCIDLACTSPKGFRFVQVCTTAGVREHRRKIEAIPWPEGEAAQLYQVEIWETREKKRFRRHLLLDRTLKQDGWTIVGWASEAEGVLCSPEAPDTPSLLDEHPKSDERRGDKE